MNPNYNKDYAYKLRMAKVVHELNKENTPRDRWGTIIGVGIAIGLISFYNNTCVQYQAVNKAIDTLKHTEVKRDSLEYRLK